MLKMVEHRLHDHTLSPETLAASLNMSRPKLFRKIKAITEMSIARFIRMVRLQKARRLLLETDLNISEIAYEVGFDDPAYFSRAFHEEFGVAPSAIRVTGA